MSGGIQVTRPQTRKEFMKTLQMPYAPNEGLQETVFTEPQKLGQPETNRAYEYTFKNDTDKIFSVGIKDIDDAVMYYFNEVLKLTVVQNNTKVNVPVIYGNPENWKSVQADGYYRDQKGKLMAPLIMIKRKEITQNRNLGNKLDGNSVRNLQLFEKKYTKRNFYSNFSALNSRSPETEYLATIIPDYVTVQYECLVWTYFVEQMDSLIESLNFSSRSYWGDPSRFLFNSSIETFQDTLSFDLGQDRAVRNSFDIILNGYLIPETEMTKVAAASKAYGVSKLVFSMETTSGTETASSTAKKSGAIAQSSVLINGSVNNIFNTSGGSLDPATLTYLNTSLQVPGTFVDYQTATFAKTWLSAPAGLPATSIANFTFFVNGQFLEQTYITSFTTDYVGTSTLVINTAALGYTLDSTDVILAIGKFK